VLQIHDRLCEAARDRVFANVGTGLDGRAFFRAIAISMMDHDWNDSQPIYRQLRDRVVAMILDGLLNEGDPLPSVRHVAAEYRINPLTVLKAYQQLVDERLVESRRGRGMFINTGARKLLLHAERQKFLAEQWPAIHATIRRLGLTPQDLMDAAARGGSSS
jgi:DNA-binding transcriptional regulator YhcF (GntR family)